MLDQHGRGIGEEGGASSPSGLSCGLCLLPGCSGLAFDSQQTGKETRLISAAEAIAKMSRGKCDPSSGWGRQQRGSLPGPCSPVGWFWFWGQLMCLRVGRASQLGRGRGGPGGPGPLTQGQQWSSICRPQSPCPPAWCPPGRSLLIHHPASSAHTSPESCTLTRAL